MKYEDQVRNRYFEWLYNYACKGRISEHISFRKLFINLYDTQFDFYIRNDVNRAMDGVNLRYRFATVIQNDEAFDILDGPCSVLEMILALAIRIEETIMEGCSFIPQMRRVRPSLFLPSKAAFPSSPR